MGPPSTTPSKKVEEAGAFKYDEILRDLVVARKHYLDQRGKDLKTNADVQWSTMYKWIVQFAYKDVAASGNDGASTSNNRSFDDVADEHAQYFRLFARFFLKACTEFEKTEKKTKQKAEEMSTSAANESWGGEAVYFDNNSCAIYVVSSVQVRVTSFTVRPTEWRFGQSPVRHVYSRNREIWRDESSGQRASWILQGATDVSVKAKAVFRHKLLHRECTCASEVQTLEELHAEKERKLSAVPRVPKACSRLQAV